MQKFIEKQLLILEIKKMLLKRPRQQGEEHLSFSLTDQHNQTIRDVL